jgi:hypothetical protein
MQLPRSSERPGAARALKGGSPPFPVTEPILIADSIGHRAVDCVRKAHRINFLSGGKITYDAATKDTSVAELVDLVSSGFRRAPAAAGST